MSRANPVTKPIRGKDRPSDVGHILEEMRSSATIDCPESVPDNLRDLPRLLRATNPVERKVISLRYGLGGRCETLAEIGSRLGMTREQVRRMETAGRQRVERFRRLRDRLSRDALGCVTASTNLPRNFSGRRVRLRRVRRVARSRSPGRRSSEDPEPAPRAGL